MRLVRSYLESEQLYVIEDAPVFSYPAYAVYPKDIDDEPTHLLIKQLMETARSVDPSK